MNTSNRAIISFFIVLIICFTTLFTISYSDPISVAVGGLSGISGMGLFGSVSSFMGADVTYTGNSEDPYNMMWTASQDDPITLNISEIHKGTGASGDEYDYIILDSQGYNDIATSVIENWIHDNSITDNSYGTIGTVTNFMGYPFETQIGASFVNPSSVGATFRIGGGNLFWTMEITRTNKCVCRLFQNGINIYTSTEQSLSATPDNYFMILKDLSGTACQCFIQRASVQYTFIGYTFQTGKTPATSINWTSSEIDTSKGTNFSQPTIKIPSAISGLTPLFTAEDFIKALAAVALAHNLNQIVIEDASSPPVPPTPIPTIPLGEVPYDQWVDTWGQHVIDNLNTGNESLDNIDTNIQTGNDMLESIDTNIGTTNGILGQIKDLIQSGFNSITSLLNQILTGVQSLVQSIVNATENLIAGILNQIPTAFQSAWNTLKQHASIWHYVVEWVQSITTPLTWIWGIASGTSYYIILPVYASLAGAVVLALYKKFGR